MSQDRDIYTLKFTDSGDAPFGGRGVCVPQGNFIRFTIDVGTNILLDNPVLVTNYPTKDGINFKRDEFSKHSPQQPYDAVNPWVVDILINLAGSFDYYLEFENGTKATQHGHFYVEPIISINGKSIPLDSIIVQTVLTKCLGTLSEWPDVLRVASESKYNMIHFTPVQQLGESNSCYSLFDQLMISNSLFEDSQNQGLDEGIKMQKLKDVINRLENEYGMLSMVDVVWNHTANNSAWLADHPEAAYNLQNSPHLKSAYDFDQAIIRFSDSLLNPVTGNGPSISSEKELDQILTRLKTELLPEIKLWEYYVIDVKTEVQRFLESFESFEIEQGVRIALSENEVSVESKVKSIEKSGIVQTGDGERFQTKINLDFVLDLYYNTIDLKQSTEALSKQYQKVLDIINLDLYKVFNEDIEAAMDNIYNTIKYSRIADYGPKLGPITKSKPLVYSLFTNLLPQKQSQFPPWPIAFANNGWIYGGSPLENFAGPKSKAYFRREVIVWGDCVKLRYGESYKDNPWIWDHMKKYTQEMAQVFHGFRIDNAHSTPIHVAQYLVDAARISRPNLYVTCELFTGSEDIDWLYVSNLGISSLIREAMQAGDNWELGRLVHRGGGNSVGSLDTERALREEYLDLNKERSLRERPLQPRQRPGSLFFECTHDNETPSQKRTTLDSLPNSALVTMTCTSIGSVRGYDELFPKKINLVAETKKYMTHPPLSPLIPQAAPPLVSELQKEKPRSQSSSHNLNSNNEKNPKANQAHTALVNEIHKFDPHIGMIQFKAILNTLHTKLSTEGFSEVHVHQDDNLITVQRHRPTDHQAIYLVAHTSYQQIIGEVKVPEVNVPGKIENFLFAGLLRTPSSSSSQVGSDSPFLTGLNSKTEFYKSFNDVCNIIDRSDSLEEKYTLKFLRFPPGSVLAFTVSIGEKGKQALQELKKLTSDVDKVVNENLNQADLLDLNVLLFRHNAEEDGNISSYNVPGVGDLTFCGIESFFRIFRVISKENNLGHSFCENLRSGNWALDYIVNRLKTRSNLLNFQNWLSGSFDCLKLLPRYLIPKYFEVVINVAHEACVKRAVSLMSTFVKNHLNDNFVRSLALTSVQLYGVVLSAPLISPVSIKASKIKDILSGSDIERFLIEESASLAAGLPHFASGYMRNWGRDTFISLRGLFLVTGRFEEAKRIIMGFAMCVRHGLIPNLLDGGLQPRYNSRDSVWWFLQAIQDYCKMAPDGLSLIQSRMVKLFPFDNEKEGRIGHHHVHGDKVSSDNRYLTLGEVIQEILEKHANGIHFREWNAGKQIDDRMQDPGFNIDITLDWNTGFLHGGNIYNCGTWMDKMGESQKAGNYGWPATSRDGAPIEITALLKSTLRWLTELSEKNLFISDGVETPNGRLTYKKWGELIQSSFEENYYIPTKKDFETNPSVYEKYAVDKKLVGGKSGYYKDVLGGTNNWAPYQNRPNQCIAMTVAPELFNRDHVLVALSTIETYLIGKLGMKTLDPQDWNFRPVYDNRTDSAERSTSKGFNYHQGPEWLWPMGYYLRAKVIFHALSDLGKKVLSPTVFLQHEIYKILRNHRVEIRDSSFAGLPELTNAGGGFCEFSCQSQAWSSATILDALSDLDNYLNSEENKK